MMTDPKFIDMVTTPFAVTYPASGEAVVRFPGNLSNMNINGYTQLSVEVGPAPQTRKFDVYMGKISGSTLSSKIATDVPTGAVIHTYPVVGPEFSLVLKGTPGATDNVQLWIYLRP